MASPFAAEITAADAGLSWKFTELAFDEAAEVQAKRSGQY